MNQIISGWPFCHGRDGGREPFDVSGGHFGGLVVGDALVETFCVATLARPATNGLWHCAFRGMWMETVQEVVTGSRDVLWLWAKVLL